MSSKIIPFQHWAHVELDRLIERSEKEGRWSDVSVVLVSNPEVRSKLEQLIRESIWPGLERLFNEIGLISEIDEGSYPNVTQEWRDQNSLSFVFIVWSEDDCETPFGKRPYFCRITTRCWSEGFMVEIDFFIHFPGSFDLTLLKPLLSNPRFSGNPPELRHESHADDEEGIWAVEFNFGRGYGFGKDLSAAPLLAEFAEKLPIIGRLISAVRRLASDYKNPHSLQKVIHELELCFPAD